MTVELLSPPNKTSTPNVLMFHEVEATLVVDEPDAHPIYEADFVEAVQNDDMPLSLRKKYKIHLCGYGFSYYFLQMA